MVRAQGGGMLSIAHRPSVAAFHTRRWVLEPISQAAEASEGTQDAESTTAHRASFQVVEEIRQAG